MTGHGSGRGGRIVAAGVGYLASVFALGFALGTIRVLVLVPALGEQTAELIELPVMLTAIVVFARFIVRRCRLSAGPRERLPAGLLALALMLGAELLVVFLVRGESLPDYVAGRDPLAGSLYLASLALFALMPWLAGGRAAEPAP